MKLIIKEIYCLMDNYYKCYNSQIKEQIIRDITFLTEHRMVEMRTNFFVEYTSLKYPPNL